MMNEILRKTLIDALTHLAIARELDASYPSFPAPKQRDLCPTCGSNNSHRLWVNFTERCVSDWHNDRG